MEAEIARLRIVLSYDSHNPDVAVKIAQLALSIGRHETALEILGPYAAAGASRGRARPRRCPGRKCTGTTRAGEEYVEGRRSLEAACAHRRKDAETLCALAESWGREDATKARDLFHQAVAVDATEPMTLSRYIEFEIAHLSNDSVVRLAAPMIRNAMDRCRKQIEARVNLPWAWASLAVLHLFVEEPYEALDAVAQLIRLCEPPERRIGRRGRVLLRRRLSAAARALLRTRDALERIQCIRESLPGFDWCRRAVLLGLAVGVKDGRGGRRTSASWLPGAQEEPHLSPNESIVILSGGCTPEAQSAIDAFKPVLLRACEGLSFTLFGGGTTSGSAAWRARGRAIRRPRAGRRLSAPALAPRRRRT